MNKHQHEKQARAVGWPFVGRFEDTPEYQDSILNPANWPPRLRRSAPIDAKFIEPKDKADGTDDDQK